MPKTFKAMRNNLLRKTGSLSERNARGLPYLVTAMSMGLARVNVAQAAWLRRLELEAEEERIRAIYAGHADHPTSPSPDFADEDRLISYRREKFHDRYIAPLTSGLLSIAMQFVLNKCAGA